MAYAIEFATFAIYFKQVHEWNEAAWKCSEFLIIPDMISLGTLWVSSTAFLPGIEDSWNSLTGQSTCQSEAKLAGVAQTAGDLMAAVSMQVIPVLCLSQYDPDKAGCLRRLFHNIMSQPYYLSFALATWVAFHIGLCCPVLAVAIVAQVLMGTTFVFWHGKKSSAQLLRDQGVLSHVSSPTRTARYDVIHVAGIPHHDDSSGPPG